MNKSQKRQAALIAFNATMAEQAMRVCGPETVRRIVQQLEEQEQREMNEIIRGLERRFNGPPDYKG